MDFDAVYEEYMRPVYAYFNLCFGADCAGDLTQETFMRLWRKLQKDPLFAPDSPRAWLFHVAVNVKNEHLRHQYRTVQTVSMEHVAESSGGGGKDYDQAMAISGAMKKLPVDKREVLILSSMGFNSNEMGEMLLASASAVRSRLAAARKQYAHLLEQEGIKIS